MDIEKISKEYFEWLKNNNNFVLHKDVIEITTPSIDSFGDSINLILKQEGNRIKVSDDSYVIWNLEAHGLNVSQKNSRRNQLLHSILDFESVNFDTKTNEIYKISSMKNIGQSIHEIMQTISKVSDLMFLNQANVKSLFSEDVFSYLKDHQDIFDYFPNLQIVGQSKLPFTFDALFTTKNRTKKLVKIYNSFTKNTVENALLSWLDTIPYRKEHYDGLLKMSIIVNDENNKSFSRDYIDALDEYDIGVIPFSDKELLKENLGAS